MKLRELYEHGGRIVKGVNTTPDVGVNQIPIEAGKFGFKVDKDGRPPELNKKARKNSSPNTLFNLGLAESKIDEIKAKELSSSSEIFVDMDGVLVDFFGAWTKLMKVKKWFQIKNVEKGLQKVRDTEDFWLNLKPTKNADKLLGIIKNIKGEYNILSAPLADDPRAEPDKRAWVEKYLKAFPPKKVIITTDKAKYATSTGGTPNILIDDKPSNIERWTAKNGIGIRYQANKDSLSKVSNAFDIIKQYMQSNDAWTPELIQKVNTAIATGKINEGELIPFPENSLVIDVDSKSDFYELTKDISDLSQADANKYGTKGKADVVITFQSPEVKDMVAKRIKKYTGMKSKDATTNNLYHYDDSKKKKKKKKVNEHGGRVVKGINTTPDVGVDAIKKQSGKLGFKVSNDGVPPKLREDEKFKNQAFCVEKQSKT